MSDKVITNNNISTFDIDGTLLLYKDVYNKAFIFFEFPLLQESQRVFRNVKFKDFF